MGLVVACAEPTQTTLRCHDLSPAGTAGFTALFGLVAAAGEAKSCSDCHNARTPIHGYDFEGKAAAYDALSTKAKIVYAQVASGNMPKVGEPWDEADLQLYRTWYCDGAFYDE